LPDNFEADFARLTSTGYSRNINQNVISCHKDLLIGFVQASVPQVMSWRGNTLEAITPGNDFIIIL